MLIRIHGTRKTLNIADQNELSIHGLAHPIYWADNVRFPQTQEPVNTADDTPLSSETTHHSPVLQSAHRLAIGLDTCIGWYLNNKSAYTFMMHNALFLISWSWDPTNYT